MTIDRRMYKRAPLRVQISIVHEDIAVIKTWTNNISVGGLQLECTGIPSNAKLKLFIPLPHDPSQKKRLFLLNGKVSWRTLNKTGVLFCDQSSDIMTMLHDYIEQHVPPPEYAA